VKLVLLDEDDRLQLIHAQTQAKCWHPLGEEWLMHTVIHFDPAPAQLTEGEACSVVGFRWWQAEELSEATGTIYHPASADY
jgi:hypothetical protein